MNLMIRKASARWRGGARAGNRTVTTGSGVLARARFSLTGPLGNNAHTDPAELIAAAYASSFSLALSNELRLRPLAVGEFVTTATVTLELLAAVWTIMNLHLDVVATLPKVTQGKFIDATVRAKTNCLVSRLLRANVSMNARLQK